MRASALGVLVGLALSVATTVAGATPDRVTFAIDCPPLDDDARAALEARARADLVLERVREGTVRVACVGSVARVAWRPVVGAPHDAQATLPADRPGAVDALLQVVHDVLVDVAAVDPRPADTTPLASIPPTAPPPTPAPPASTAPPPEPSATGVHSEPEALATPAISRWRVLAGARSELWSGAIGAALGADAGVRMVVSGPWRVAALAGPSWGLTGASGIHAWTLHVGARAELVPWRHLALSAGIDARLLWASGGSPAFAQSTLDGTTGGATVGAAYLARLGPLDVSLGPAVEALLRPVIVQVNGQELFRLPTFVASLSLEASTR
jgi:hypothetical protein